MDKWEKEILNKIDNGEKLTGFELSELTCNDIERECGDNGRWSRSVESICQIGDRYFSIVWEQGLTERQENEYYNQPVEVNKVTYEKTITVTEWRDK